VGNFYLAAMPSKLYEKHDFERYLSQMGLVKQSNGVLIFETFDSALEWIEEHILADHGLSHSEVEQPFQLKDLYSV